MSSNTNKVVPSITARSKIPDLIKFVWFSFQPDECLKVEKILMNREKEFTMELEKLRKDNVKLKEERDLMEKKHGLSALNKLKYESELKLEMKKLLKDNFRLKEEHDLAEKKQGLHELKKPKYESELMEIKRECHKLKLELDKLWKDNARLREERDSMEKKQGLTEAKKFKCESELMESKKECHDLNLKIAKYTELLLEAKKKNSIIYSEKLKSEEKMGRFIGNLYNEKNLAEENEKRKSRIVSEYSSKIKVLESEKLELREKLKKLIEELNDEKRMAKEKNQMLLKVEKENSSIFSKVGEKIMGLKKEKLEMEEILARLTQELDNEKKMVVEKSKIVSEFSSKIKVLEGDKLEMEEKLVTLIEELNGEKKRVEEMNQILLMVEKEKGRLYLEFSEKIDSLEREKLQMEENFWMLTEELNSEKKIAEEKLLSVETEKNLIVSEFTEKIEGLELKKEKAVSEYSEKRLKFRNLKEKVICFDNRAFIGDANPDLQLQPDAEISNKLNHQTELDPIIIDLSESDDDLPTRETPCISNKEVENERSSLEDKKIKKDTGESYLVNTCSKRKRSEREEEIQKNGENKLMCVADMNSSLKQDPQLCLKTVCTLHRSTSMKGLIYYSKGWPSI